MLEVRYNKLTGVVTGWWASRHGNQEAKLKNRSDEAVIILDIPLPNKPLGSVILKDKQLIPNPDYTEPAPSKIEKLTSRIEVLELEAENV